MKDATKKIPSPSRVVEICGELGIMLDKFLKQVVIGKDKVPDEATAIVALNLITSTADKLHDRLSFTPEMRDRMLKAYEDLVKACENGRPSNDSSSLTEPLRVISETSLERAAQQANNVEATQSPEKVEEKRQTFDEIMKMAEKVGLAKPTTPVKAPSARNYLDETYGNMKKTRSTENSGGKMVEHECDRHEGFHRIVIHSMKKKRDNDS